MDSLVNEVRNQLSSAWKFRWLGVAAAWMVCLVGWVAVGLLPDKYEAVARVYVDTSSDLQNILGNQIVENDLDDQLSFVREAMLGRVQLEKVVMETGLGEGISSKEDMTRFLGGMRANLEIIRHPVESNPGREATGASYSIVFVHTERATAEKVVDGILRNFMDASLGDKLASSKASEKFLEEQIEIYEERLAQAEDDLAKFNRENYDRLPSMQGGYFQRLQTETQGLSDARQALRVAQSRVNRIQLQLRGDMPRTTASGELDPTSLEARIARAEYSINELTLRYTEGHPDVIASRELLAALREELETERAEAEAGGTSLAEGNPVYQAALIARNEAQEEVAVIEAGIGDRELRVRTLRGYIDEMPDVEAELAQLNRDYNVINEKFQSLINSLERERLTREVLLTEQIDFRIIDPPHASSESAAPKRAVFLVLVLMAGVGAGAVGVYLLAQLFPTFASASAIQNKLDLAVIGTISRVRAPLYRRQRVRSMASLAIACTFLLVVFSAVVVFELVGPGLRSLI